MQTIFVEIASPQALSLRLRSPTREPVSGQPCPPDRAKKTELGWGGASYPTEVGLGETRRPHPHPLP